MASSGSHPMIPPPRDYQVEDVDAVINEWRSVRATLGIGATGLGKTRIAVEVVKRMMPCRTLFLAHRAELIWQARLEFLAHGLDCDVEKAELSADAGLFAMSPVVLASVDTLKSGKPNARRMKRFNPKLFKVVIYDESHHSVSKGNKEIVDYFLNGNLEIKVLGLTATPDRLDAINLGIIFDSIAFKRDIQFGVDSGWLVEPVPLIATTGKLDYSHVRKNRSGDLNEQDLAFVLEQQEAAAKMGQPTLETMYGIPENHLAAYPVEDWAGILQAKGEPLRTLIFTVSVKQAEIMCNYLNRVIPGLAGWVCGKTPDDDRSELYRSFESGSTYAMVNVGVATEGYDNPNIGLIVMGRPTMSRSLCAQIIGRGTRPLRGLVNGLMSKEARLCRIALSSKPRLLVLDFAANTGTHKLVNVFHLMAGSHSEEAVERAIQRVAKDKVPMKVRDVIAEEEEALKREIEKSRLVEEAKKSNLVAKVAYTTHQVDPFNSMDMESSHPRGCDRTKKLSPGVQRVLQGQGIDWSNLPYNDGMRMFREVMWRLTNKLARPRQIEVLQRFYPDIDYKTLKSDRASQILDALKENKWRKVDLSSLPNNTKT